MKTWFITGAGRGFGRQWAQAALERGDRVAATARKVEALADLKESFGEKFLPLALDVTDRAGVFAAVEEANQYFGQLDVILSNAGFGAMGAVEEVPEDMARANFDTNVFGTLNLIQAALPILRAQGSGHIIGVSSVAGILGNPTAGIYCGAKFAVEGILESLATEVAGFGIKVSIIEPGGYKTDFLSANSISSAPEMDIYNPLRESLAAMLTEDDLGDPRATPQAILALVDAEQPPLRLILGTLLPLVKDVYAQRLDAWEQWDDVARSAFRVTAPTAEITEAESAGESAAA